MIERDISDPSFSDAEIQDLHQYRPVSRLSLVALLLGALSATALISPVFWAVPVAAIILVVAALRAITASESGLIGRKAALGALVLAMLFGGWAPARRFAHRQALYQQASVFAQQWLDLLREGRLEEVHELHLPFLIRRPRGVSLKEYYAENKEEEEDRRENMSPQPDRWVPSPHQALVEFFGAPPLNILVAHSRQGRLQLDRNESQQPTPEGDIIIQRYLFHYEDGGQPRSLPVRLFFQRAFNWRLGEARWQLETIADAGDASP